MAQKPITVIFCLPGATFSGRFLECWSNLLSWCFAHGIQPVISRKQSNNICFVRNMCLGGDVMRGAAQKPFNGELDYDYICWIDSDTLVAPQQFQQLLSHDKDIISGLYLMEGDNAFATVQHWDEEYFKKHGCFQFLTPQDINGKEGLLKVDYTGMGFMLVKKGVFESLEYPWFRPLEKRIGNMVDFTMEDVGFCLQARERGWNVLVDTGVRVGHEKKILI